MLSTIRREIFVKLTLTLAFVVFVVFAVNTIGRSGGISKPLPFSAPKYEFEDLNLELYSDGNIIFVSGKIRNMTYKPVRGFAIVYFKDKGDDVIHSVETEVNSGKTFVHGKAGYFEATENIENIPGIENVSVEFVPDQ